MRHGARPQGLITPPCIASLVRPSLPHVSKRLDCYSGPVELDLQLPRHTWLETGLDNVFQSHIELFRSVAVGSGARQVNAPVP